MDTPVKNSRKIQAENTKRKIFDAAMRLLDTHDFDEITIREIVKEAEVSTGSFYHYYTTKLDVFYETYEIADSYFEETVRPSLKEGTALEKIQRFFDEYARYHYEVTPFKLTKILYNPDNTLFHRKESSMTKLLTELCEEAAASGQFRASLPSRELASHLMICVRGVIYDWCLGKGQEDLLEKVRYHLGFLLDAFTA